MNFKPIEEYLNTYGYVIVGPIISKEFIKSGINEIVQMFAKQPRVKGLELNLTKLTGLTGKEVKELRKRWVPHVTFGAPCEPGSFHLNHAWAIRQSEYMYNLFSYLHKTENICVTIDRFKAKLPGSGEREFCHWDSDPRSWNFTQEELSLQGIVALTDIEFVCVPGTHTKEFIDKVLPLYPYIGGQPLNKIDKTKDPLKLCDKEQKIKVPAGSIIIFNNKLLHSSHPNRTKEIKFAYYISYDRRENIKQSKEDRIRTYLTGLCPKLFPSGGKAYHMPPTWARYTNHARKYHERLPEHLREFRTNNKGKSYPIIVERTPNWYVPPKLTKLGFKLLGLEPGETIEKYKK